MLCFASICPHPPIIIPSIGGGELKNVKKTIEAMGKLADDFALAKPETVILISPHGPVQIDKMTITTAENLSGDFGQFGDFEAELNFGNNPEIVAEIKKSAAGAGIPVDLLDFSQLDHGVLVPLWYLTRPTKSHPDPALAGEGSPAPARQSSSDGGNVGLNKLRDSSGFRPQNDNKVKLVPIAFSFLDYQTHFKFGQIIGERLAISNKRFAIVASGDLSHRITQDAPAGYSPRGKEFDEKLVELLKENDVKGILNLDADLIEEAGECGLRSIIILLGALSELQVISYKLQVLSYEAPFGVGYLVAKYLTKVK